MVDKGFDLETDLPVGVTLSIPLCHRDKKHLSIQEETETRRIASLRIHVERAIARIKNHNMLKTIFPIAMAAKFNKTWVVCCYLSKFLQPFIVEEE